MHRSRFAWLGADFLSSAHDPCRVRRPGLLGGLQDECGHGEQRRRRRRGGRLAGQPSYVLQIALGVGKPHRRLMDAPVFRLTARGLKEKRLRPIAMPLLHVQLGALDEGLHIG